MFRGLNVKTGILGLGFALVMGPAIAESLGPDAISEIYQDCIVECLGAEDAVMCENLCSCAANGMAEVLTVADYERLKTQLSDPNGQLDADLLAIIQQIGADCAAELEL